MSSPLFEQIRRDIIAASRHVQSGQMSPADERELDRVIARYGRPAVLAAIGERLDAIARLVASNRR